MSEEFQQGQMSAAEYSPRSPGDEVLLELPKVKSPEARESPSSSQVPTPPGRLGSPSP